MAKYWSFLFLSRLQSMFFYFNLIIQIVGAVTLFYWFFSNTSFFYFLNKYKKRNPVLLFILPFFFIAYPAILAFSFKSSWDFYYEASLAVAFFLSLIPMLFFCSGCLLFRTLKRRESSKLRY
jgi:hypothetical protein